MLVIHSYSGYIEYAMREVFLKPYSSIRSNNIKNDFIVMDFSFFTDIEDIFLMVKYYAKQMRHVKILLILDDNMSRFRGLFTDSCVTMSDGIHIWTSVITNIIWQKNNTEKVLSGLMAYIKIRSSYSSQDKVLALIKEGRKVTEIAALLHISPKTVYSHCDMLRKKYRQPNLAHLYHFASNLQHC